MCRACDAQIAGSQFERDRLNDAFFCSRLRLFPCHQQSHEQREQIHGGPAEIEEIGVLFDAEIPELPEAFRNGGERDEGGNGQAGRGSPVK